jgi:hypothetical protein
MPLLFIGDLPGGDACFECRSRCKAILDRRPGRQIYGQKHLATGYGHSYGYGSERKRIGGNCNNAWRVTPTGRAMLHFGSVT